MRVAVQYRMASKENYRKFIQETGSSLSFLEWSNIIYSFNYGMRDWALETGDIVKLPWGFGEFAISKKKRKKILVLPTGEEKIGLAIDWSKTKKAGKYIYHMNYHTEGFNFKWKWFCNTARFSGHKLWVMKPSRISSRLITFYVNKGNSNKYREWHIIKR